jgi:large repetitive protein
VGNMGKRITGILLSVLLVVPMDAFANTTPQDQYVIISNESNNITNEQFTGSFQLKGKETYQVDAQKPFDAYQNRNKQIRKSTFSITNSYRPGDSKSFWVTDFTTYMDYQINATLKYSGSKVNVWVYNDQLSTQDAEKLGLEFDNNIRPIIEQNFGYESDVDGNGKVNILSYDIKDRFSGYGGYIGGYFYGGDLFNQEHSNQSEIFYIDTYPLMGISVTKDVTEAYGTLAHEFQHMVNFNRNVLVEGSFTEMDIWLDEALSMAAEQMYTGKVLADRIDYYNYSSSITNGQSLLKWNHNGDALANYSLSYLFGQYVKVQANQGNRIFKEMINSPYNDYRAVELMIKKYINSSMSFGQFMTSFRGALLLKQSEGLYGFKGDPSFESVKPKIYTGSSINLAGGSAVVKKINAAESLAVPVSKGENITYTFLTNNGDMVAPGLPNVNSVSDRDLKVTGKTEANAKVFIAKGSTIIGNSQADSNGNFSVVIPAQTAGSTLSIYVEDLFGNRSATHTVSVLDKTPPANPTVNPVADNQTSVTGKTEGGATVYVKVGITQIGKGVATSNGTFTISIPKQKSVTILSVYAVDKAGNIGTSSFAKVLDKTAPNVPSVDEVKDYDKKVSGKGEVGATVAVKEGSKVIGSGKVDGAPGSMWLQLIRLKRQEPQFMYP